MEFSKIADFFLSKSFLLNSAIIAVIVNVTWRIMSLIYRGLKYYFVKKNVSFDIELELPLNFREGVEFYCLIVRHGTDDYIRHMASDREKDEGRLRNKKIPIKVIENSDIVTLKLKLPVHKRLGTQFKCFLQIDNSDQDHIEKMEIPLKNNDNIYGVSGSKSRYKSRIFFNLNNFGTTKSVEGIENNMCFPE